MSEVTREGEKGEMSTGNNGTFAGLLRGWSA